MKICHVVHTGGWGGGSRVLRDCVLAARAHGHENTVVCGAGGPLAGELRSLGVDVVDVPHGGKLTFAFNLPALTRLFTVARPHVVLLYGPVAGCYGVLAAALARAPSLYEAHFPSFFADTSCLKRLRNQLVELISCRLSRAVTVLTESDREEYVRRRLQSPDRLFVVPTGVSVESAPREDVARVRAQLLDGGTYLIVAGGRMAEEKGFDVLVEAMSVAARCCPGARLHLAGEGECRAELEAAVRQRGLEPWVRFHDFQSGFYLWIQAADLVVVPSRYEPAGLVTREAMMAGKPVVATAVSGSIDAVEDGHTGLLVPAEDPRALAEAICRVGADPALAARLGLAASAVARERFTVERMWAGYEQVLETVGLMA